MTNTDTSPEAVEQHLDINQNHAAGLIPLQTQMLLRALSAELEQVKAERDAQQAHPQAVTVKPLEISCDDPYVDTVVGMYMLSRSRDIPDEPDDASWDWEGRAEFDGGRDLTNDEAISQIKAHYEQRILSAITARPAHEVRKEALEEAAQWHDHHAKSARAAINVKYPNSGGNYKLSLVALTHNCAAAAIRAMIEEGKE